MNEESRQGRDPGRSRDGAAVSRRVQPERRTHGHDGDTQANATKERGERLDGHIEDAEMRDRHRKRRQHVSGPSHRRGRMSLSQTRSGHVNVED